MVDTTTTETVARANDELITSAYDAFARGDIQGAISHCETVPAVAT